MFKEGFIRRACHSGQPSTAPRATNLCSKEFNQQLISPTLNLNSRAGTFARSREVHLTQDMFSAFLYHTVSHHTVLRKDPTTSSWAQLSSDNVKASHFHFLGRGVHIFESEWLKRSQGRFLPRRSLAGASEQVISCASVQSECLAASFGAQVPRIAPSFTRKLKPQPNDLYQPPRTDMQTSKSSPASSRPPALDRKHSPCPRGEGLRSPRFGLFTLSWS